MRNLSLPAASPTGGRLNRTATRDPNIKTGGRDHWGEWFAARSYIPLLYQGSMRMPDILETAREAARAAGKVITGSRQGRVTRKASNDLVTEADILSQETIFRIIRSAFPGHAVMGEETWGNGKIPPDRSWIVDPLDGTNNYAHGIPHYCVSIGYVEGGVPRAGVVYDPVRKEMFWACHGSGAFLNGRPLCPSKAGSLRDAIVCFGFYYDRGALMRDTLAAVTRLLEANIRGLRRTGAAALDLCWVACGRFDAFFEYRLSPWDFAAGLVIAAEAGARVRSAAGAAPALAPGSIVAVAPGIADAFSDLVRWEPA
ncbi:MAG: inositol monophosphatase [Chitinivibrionales bacterium]|nr:inositol monophosphatase [Chitinivibrionales bacterium]MBD3394175.1 inositol monophosphatase [Chitinivibrionales bacterium]